MQDVTVGPTRATEPRYKVEAKQEMWSEAKVEAKHEMMKRQKQSKR